MLSTRVGVSKSANLLAGLNAAVCDIGCHPTHLPLFIRQWVDREYPGMQHVGCFNFAVVAAEQGEWAQSIAGYQAALEIYPEFGEARINLGLVYERFGKNDAALSQWHLIGSRNDGLGVVALNHSARLLEKLGRYDRALSVMLKSLELNLEQPAVIYHATFLAQRLCQWPILSGALKRIGEERLTYVSPLSSLSLWDSPSRQLESSRAFLERNLCNQGWQDFAGVPPSSGKKIKIGYLTASFSLHPVGVLAGEFLPHHDRQRYEVVVFDYGVEDATPQRRRLIESADAWVNIASLDDSETIALLRGYRLDVLIDMQGLSSGAKLNVLDARAAPLQMSYLGYMGSSGLRSMDYIVTDGVLVVGGGYEYFSESPLCLDSGTFPLLNHLANRKGGGLAAKTRRERKVMACLNNSYKVSDEIFDVWLSVLAEDELVDLHLLEDNVWQRKNMLNRALERGLAASRLVFHARAGYDVYIDWLISVPDLCVDTFPYGGGATSVDVVGAGVPLVTMSGNAPVSRMGKSILSSLGLGEFAACNVHQYGQLISSLLKDDLALQQYRARLIDSLVEVPRINRERVNQFETSIAHLVSKGRANNA